jgi:hypothetical protein
MLKDRIMAKLSLGNHCVTEKSRSGEEPFSKALPYSIPGPGKTGGSARRIRICTAIENPLFHISNRIHAARFW